MQQETLIETLTEKLNQLFTDPKHFVVEVRIKPTNNIKVFLDGDEGLLLADLVRYNKKLYRDLEEGGLFPDGDFSLEVSSPGVDEPLKLFRQYVKNIGRYVEVTLTDAEAPKIEGKLLSATEKSIVVETESGKARKKEVKQETILFTDIKQTTVQVKF